jgi:hypothetical protein
MDQAHHVGAFDTEGRGKLALAHAGVGLDQAEYRIVDRADGDVPERFPEILEDQNLRQSQAITDDTGERRLVDGVRPAGRAGLLAGPFLGQSGSSPDAMPESGVSLTHSGDIVISQNNSRRQGWRPKVPAKWAFRRGPAQARTGSQ